MPEWLKVTLALLVFGGILWAMMRLLRGAQEVDPSKRGRDTNEFADSHENSGPD
jgi:hypothetical protein